MSFFARGTPLDNWRKHKRSGSTPRMRAIVVSVSCVGIVVLAFAIIGIYQPFQVTMLAEGCDTDILPV
jgi:hypothetical protein